jgi:uncharacterized linocin/CFP29 family protein
MDEISGFSANQAGAVTGFGSVAQRLLANGFNVNALRTNDVLRKEDWLLFDRTVVEVARANLVGVADLMAAGLSMPLANALGTTVVQWEKSSDMTDAELTMTGIAAAQRDRMEFAQVNLPVPIVHKDFQMSVRNLNSRNRTGMPLDTTQVTVAARRVSDLLEKILFQGASITAGGGTIYGYTNFPSRNTGSVTADWSAVATTGDQIVGDITTKLIPALVADNMYGPYQLYVSNAAYTNMLKDLKAASDKSIIQRILEIPGIKGVKGTNQLTGTNVLLVQMTRDVVDIVDGIQPTPVMWESHGGMLVHFKVMAIMVPRLKADFTGQCGIAHFS